MPTENHPTSHLPHGAPKGAPRAGRHVRMLAMTSAAAIMVVGLGAFALLPAAHLQAVTDLKPIPIATTSSMARLPEGTPSSFADLVERVSPAVVTITSETMTTEADADGDGTPDNLPAPFRDLFNQFNQAHPQQPHKAISAGSGFIIDKSGLIVTNNHVVDNGKKITVTLPDKRHFDATLVGTDPATDIALLRIKSDKPLPTVTFGDDRNLRVGDWVVAVGNPFGLSNSVTAGIVSSLGRDVGGGTSNYNDFIQIDAPINRGNSGGPTFDLKGQVVGMNSMIFSPSGGSVGIGFAIPATTIHDVVGELQAHGHVSRGWLGVEIQSVTPEIASSLGLKSEKGAIVATVVPGGPAAKAGFQQGDIVTAIDGKEVEDNRDVTRKVATVAAGATANFTVNRQGAVQNIKVQIGARPADKVASVLPATPSSIGPTASAMGLGLSPLTAEVRKSLNLAEGAGGVVITKVDPNSDAADKGLQAGDVLLKVGSMSVKTPQDVQSGVAEAKKGGRKTVLLLVARSQGGTGFVAVDIGQT
jgi:serine protease Do